MTEATIRRQRCRIEFSDSSDPMVGELIGAPLISSGELVFTTGMVGYTEAITDPSYFGQILVFTYPLIGNYGIPQMPPKELSVPIVPSYESDHAQAAGVVIAVDSAESFHWSSLHSIDGWLRDQNVPCIVGVDTRHLVHKIRSVQGLKARIVPDESCGTKKIPILSESCQDFIDPSVSNIMPAVSRASAKKLLPQTTDKILAKIAVLDCGVKWNIIRQLLQMGCEVCIYPWDTDLKQVQCDGWILSNGPGNPENTGDLVVRLRKLLQTSKPVLGICLGHQLLALAAGAKTERMPYGHRSHNQPVYEVGKNLGYITSQNHGYVVAEESLPQDWEVWFRNANDHSIEGIRHLTLPFRSVQFHPEAAGGPRDTGWILAQFISSLVSER